MGKLIIALLAGTTIAGLALGGLCVIQEGINQAIEWLEDKEEEAGGEDDTEN